MPAALTGSAARTRLGAPGAVREGGTRQGEERAMGGEARPGSLGGCGLRTRPKGSGSV